MSKNKLAYKYIKNNSICHSTDEYLLTVKEYYKLYSFYVTYSMCKTQSNKKRDFIDYGWDNNDIENKKKELSKIIDFNIAKFIFANGGDNMGDLFNDYNLNDGNLENIDEERGVIGITNESNVYMKFFHRIRNGFAHAHFCLRYDSKGNKMVIIQDNDQYNVTARIVIKLKSLLKFIRVIDKNKRIYSYNKKN